MHKTIILPLVLYGVDLGVPDWGKTEGVWEQGAEENIGT
jgi:hypothetical protein